MNQDKIQQIIDSKNEQRERQIVRSAEEIIENIIREQQAIAASNERIVKLREELAALEVTPINASAVLGQ